MSQICKNCQRGDVSEHGTRLAFLCPQKDCPFHYGNEEYTEKSEETHGRDEN